MSQRKCCGCRICTGETPKRYQVVLAGLTNFTCMQCDAINGTYILEQIVDPALSPWSYEAPPRCLYQYDFGPDAPCPSLHLTLEITGGSELPVTEITLIVRLWSDANEEWEILIWLTVLNDNGNTCSCTLVNQPVVWSQGTWGVCTPSNSACTVTSL